MGGKTATYDTEVIPEGEIIPVTDAWITQGDFSSKVIKGKSNGGNYDPPSSGWDGNQEYQYNGVYTKSKADGKSYEFSLNYEPGNAQITSVKWMYEAPNGKSYLLDYSGNKVLSSPQSVDDNGSKRVKVKFDGNANATPDGSVLTAIINDTSGKTTTVKFYILYEGSTPCFKKGTIVKTNHGNKPIESINGDDLVLSFNHFKGEYEYQEIAAVIDHGMNDYQVMELTFEDGTKIGFINSHGLFDCELRRYVDFTIDTYKNYLGHAFIKCDGKRNAPVKLVDVEICTERTVSYTLVANQNLNCVANDMLNITSVLHGIYNIFSYDENLKFNKNDVEDSVKKYGMYSPSDFKNLFDEALFEAYGFKYFKIAIGKEILTYEILMYYVQWLKSCMENGEAVIYKGHIY